MAAARQRWIYSLQRRIEELPNDRSRTLKVHLLEKDACSLHSVQADGREQITLLIFEHKNITDS